MKNIKQSSNNIVITGAQGFIGRHLVARLIKEGMNVLAVDKVTFRHSNSPNLYTHVTDLVNFQELLPPDFVRDKEFTLIHLAWDLNRGSEYKSQADQVSILSGLLDYWNDKGLSFLIVIGSSEEYGNRSGIIKEDDLPVLPLSPYGWAKNASCTLSTCWAIKNDIPLIWFRPFIVYGPGQSGDMIIPYAIRQARDKKIAEFTDGMQKRDFIYIDDVVQFIILSLKKKKKGVNIINLGRGKEVLVKNVIENIAQLFDAEEYFKFGVRSMRPEEPKIKIADTTRAKNILGWQSNITWQNGLLKIYNSIKCN